MSYSQTFTKNTFLNDSDQNFVEGVSPSISAEFLNGVQDAVATSLAANDTNAADIDSCEADIADLQTHTAGIKCEILNTPVSIAVASWTENTTKLRYETQISNASIRTDTDVEFTVCDDQNGQYAIGALLPTNGSITLFISELPTVAISMTMSVWEVRTIE